MFRGTRISRSWFSGNMCFIFALFLSSAGIANGAIEVLFMFALQGRVSNLLRCQNIMFHECIHDGGLSVYFELFDIYCERFRV